MAAGSLDLTIEQGATYLRIIEYVDANNSPIDLTDKTVKMQIRNNYTTDLVILDLTDNYISITDYVGGEITINIPASVTQTLPITKGYYDIELHEGLEVERMLQGSVTISPEVTK